MLLSAGTLERIEAMIEQGRIYDVSGTLSRSDATFRGIDPPSAIDALARQQPHRVMPDWSERNLLQQVSPAFEVNWLDLPDFNQLLALRRHILLEDDARE
jgi:hypothetical protein